MTLLLASFASGAAFPEKSITLVVGFPAGSAPDVAARVVSQKLSNRLINFTTQWCEEAPAVDWRGSGQSTKLETLVVLKIKKDLDNSKSLISLALLAPRPGLEPGTYGLTEIQARQKSI